MAGPLVQMQLIRELTAALPFAKWIATESAPLFVGLAMLDIEAAKPVTVVGVTSVVVRVRVYSATAPKPTRLLRFWPDAPQPPGDPVSIVEAVS